MDDSEVYVRMSEKSPLQEIWVPAAWDYIYCRYEKKVVVLSGYPTDSGFYGHGIDDGDECHDSGGYHRHDGSWDKFKEDHFCLFCQDQLQAILYPGYIRVFINVVMFPTTLEPSWEHKFPYFCHINAQFASMEQLWHAFVVKEKYNKIWSGEDWI